MMVAEVVGKVVGHCAHCLRTLLVEHFGSRDAFLRYEQTGLCEDCQVVAVPVSA